MTGRQVSAQQSRLYRDLGHGETFFKQPMVEKVSPKFIKGFSRCEWFKDQGVRNEAFDRRVYAMCALYSRTIPWEILYRSAPTDPPPADPAGGPPAPK
jgi:phage terminase large subunit GpA-like protein